MDTDTVSTKNSITLKSPRCIQTNSQTIQLPLTNPSQITDAYDREYVSHVQQSPGVWQ